jgi:hypothetical protein
MQKMYQQPLNKFELTLHRINFPVGSSDNAVYGESDFYDCKLVMF